MGFNAWFLLLIENQMSKIEILLLMIIEKDCRIHHLRELKIRPKRRETVPKSRNHCNFQRDPRNSQNNYGL